MIGIKNIILFKEIIILVKVIWMEKVMIILLLVKINICLQREINWKVKVNFNIIHHELILLILLIIKYWQIRNHVKNQINNKERNYMKKLLITFPKLSLKKHWKCHRILLKKEVVKIRQDYQVN